MNNEIDSHQLKAFRVLAKTKNFTKAAKEIGLSQSAFSQRIKNLETSLGCTLVIRAKKETLLTEAGEKVLRYAQKIKSLDNELLNSINHKNEYRGQIRIASFSSVFRSLLLPSIARILRQHKFLNLKSYSVELRELLPLLKSSEVNYIISNKDYSSANIESIFLGHESNVHIASKKYKGINHYLDHDEEDVTTSSYFKLTKTKPIFSKKRYVDDSYGLIDGVRLGLGEAIVPLHLISGMKDIKIINKSKSLDVSVYLSFFKQDFHENIHHEIVETIVSNFRKSLKY